MKVSVIIPAYKPAHLPQALESVFAQSYADSQVIVVNDGSPFELRKVLQPFIETGWIVYIEQQNKGIAGARNRGLEEARGEYIAFLDDDDYWPPGKLEWQVRYLDEHPDVGMVVGDAMMVDGTGKVRGGEPVKGGLVTLEGMFGGCNITSPGQTLIRRALFNDRSFLDETIWGADDFDLWLALARKTAVMIVRRLALYYRWHQENASRDNLSMCLSTQRVAEKHLALAPVADRRRLRCATARWLYPLRGVNVIRAWKRRLLRREWRDNAKYLYAISWFVRSALFDRGLFAMVCKELLPARFLRIENARDLHTATDSTVKVSVIIPAYKPEHLREALASVYAQTYADYEVIVVNDGSPFEIRKLLDTERIRYIEQENSGTASARNRGLAEAKGEFVALLDDDDYWPADKLEWQVRYLEEHPDVGMVVGVSKLVDDTGGGEVEFSIKPGPVTLEEFIGAPSIHSPGQTLIRRSLIGAGFDEEIRGADDFDLWLRLVQKAGMVNVPRLALNYRQHRSGASRDSLLMCLGCQRVLRRHLHFASTQSRPGLRAAAARYLYAYRGQNVVRDWKRRILRGKLGQSWKYISVISWFIKWGNADRNFCSMVWKEILPARLVGKRFDAA